MHFKPRHLMEVSIRLYAWHSLPPSEDHPLRFGREWVGSSACLDTSWSGNSCACREPTPVIQPVASPLTEQFQLLICNIYC